MAPTLKMTEDNKDEKDGRMGQDNVELQNTYNISLYLYTQ